MRTIWSSARISILVGLVLAAGLAGCEMEPGQSDPNVRFSQGGWVPDDVVDPLPSSAWDVASYDRGPLPDYGHAVEEDTAEPATDTGGPTTTEDFEHVPVVTGALSSYSRGRDNPSLRQWYDRARALGVRAVVFADTQYRTESAHAFYQFSDENPDTPLQHVFRFDFAFLQTLFQTGGEGSEAKLITKEDEPLITFDPAISLRSVADGWAEAAYSHEGGFDYDLQDVDIMLRVKVPQKNAGSRVLFRATYGLGQNKTTFTWVLSWHGEPGEGMPVDFNCGANFHTYYLPLKEVVVADLGEVMWREGALLSIELRTEGETWAIYDHMRLQVDAWFATYLEETTRYSDSQIRFIPGVEHSFSTPYGQFNCVAPDKFPSSDKTIDDGLMEDFAQAGCLSVANRPLAAGATISPERAILAGAVEVWHPLFETDEGNIDTAWWDGLIVERGSFPALASAAPDTLDELDATSPHNVALVESFSDEDILAAIAAGRTYMTDDIDVRAHFWLEDGEGERVEIGEETIAATRVHAQVECPGAIESARLHRVMSLNGDATNIPLTGAEDELVMDVSDWHDCFVRLEAVCDDGARLYTNPIFIR